MSTSRSQRRPARSTGAARAASPAGPARPARPARTVIRADSPQDIVAAVPYLCGFHPSRSIVLISLRGPRKRLGMTSRLDIPPAKHHGEAAAQLAEFVARDDGECVVALIYDDLPWADPSDRPHQGLVEALLDALAERGRAALDVLYVTSERFWSYLCSEQRCCPEEGRLVADALSSPVAAAYVMAGLAPLASRELMVGRLTLLAPALVADVEDSMWRWLEAQAADLDAAVGTTTDPEQLTTIRREHLRHWTGETFRLMAPLVASYRAGLGSDAGATTLTVEQAGQLLASLHSRDVRDAVLVGFCRYGFAISDQHAQLLDLGFDGELAVFDNFAPDAEFDRDTEDAVTRLLIDVCVRVDGPFACAPLTLLGWHSWARGDGALARVAVELALTKDPTYRLASLLISALDGALAPDWVREARREDEEAG